MRPALLDRRAQRGAGAEQVLLPDELLERARAHAGRERRAGGDAGRLLAFGGIEERVHAA